MYPLLQFGNLTLVTYWVVFVFTLSFCFLPFLGEAKRKGISPLTIILLILPGIPFSFIIAHLYFWIFYYPRIFLEEPFFIFLFWKGGLAFHGGVLGGIIWGLIFAKIKKISFWKLADTFAPFFALGEALQRIGCFLNGCCYGKETTVPWAVVFTHPSAIAPKYLPLHPTQLYLSLGSFFIFLFLWSKRKKIIYNGQVFLNYLILHSLFRSIVENFRADALHFGKTGIKTAQLLGGLLIIISLLIKNYRVRKTKIEITAEKDLPNNPM
ncbi:MAG: prolipoprotein diacylglyceryl transferase [Candidatus Omnitrophica bacterium]|nr:prolipoprotein diacylglyceryl transferase [Candidatus Omnitrophota bacterium]MCM8793839.1 prolipoprotein diacylglyceryl transferase [Candidatus Omnitrophota bacterium]